MNKNDFKIIHSGRKRYLLHDLFYRVLRTSWLNFFIFSGFFYVVLNYLFALIYYFSPAIIANARPESMWDAFVFSFQTSSTLGYGHLLPRSNLTHIIVILDTIMGIFYVAIITGLAFSKFARPSAKILFTDKILFSTFDNIPTLVFRIANGRDTHIVDAALNVAILLPYVSKEGIEIRRVYKLPLLSNNNPSFSLTWTAMHQMNEDSPLHGLTLDELKEKNAIIFISLTGIDDVLSQSIHANHRYVKDNIFAAKKFADVLTSDNKKHTYTVDFKNFHNIVD